MNDLQYMGQALRTLRRAKGLSQIQVAVQSGINPSYYSRIERGDVNPSVKKIFTILTTLEVSLEEYCRSIAREKGVFLSVLPERKHVRKRQ